MKADLPCSTVPETVKALKEEIEEQHSIPTIIQTLSCQGATLVDEKAKLKIKAGDTIEVMEICA